MQGNGKSADSRINLISDFLSASGHKNHLDEAALRAASTHMGRKFSENGLNEQETAETEAKARFTKTNALQGHASGSVGGLIKTGAAAAKERGNDLKDKARAKSQSDNVLLMAMLADIDALETQLANQYGENFAGDLFSDLHVKGLIDNDDYTRIMAIEDETERRRAIAQHIQAGVDNGTIKPDDLKGHAWANDWLQLHGKATHEMTRQAAQYERGDVGANTISENAKDEAGQSAFDRNTECETAVELAVVAKDKSNDEASGNETVLAANIDLSAMMKPS